LIIAVVASDATWRRPYRVLLESTHGWHDGTADPWPWLSYFTGIIAAAYAVFADRAASARTAGTKQQRIREHILRHPPARFRLAGIRTAAPGVSDQTIRLVLEQLKNEGKVRSDGTGRDEIAGLSQLGEDGTWRQPWWWRPEGNCHV
jgi:hypothetical protein